MNRGHLINKNSIFCIDKQSMMNRTEKTWCWFPAGCDKLAESVRNYGQGVDVLFFKYIYEKCSRFIDLQLDQRSRWHVLANKRKAIFITWLADVISFRVAVCGVADWCIVWVRWQLMIQLLWAIDKNGQMLHLVRIEQKNMSRKHLYTRHIPQLLHKKDFN